MPEYARQPLLTLSGEHVKVHSFVHSRGSGNRDDRTVDAFGDEWNKFSDFVSEDIERVAAEYFDLLDLHDLKHYSVLDAGCGSGRWSRFLAPYVKSIEAIDPNTAIVRAAEWSRSIENIRFTQASIDALPFAKKSFDLVICLGVLHHMPDTQKALKDLCSVLKPDGSLLLYLYYDLSDRGRWYKSLFRLVDWMRRWICRLPSAQKEVVCEVIAALVYWPLARLSGLASLFSKRMADRLPLSYYRDKSFYIMRNDALDRFGTPLEKRFSREEIVRMLAEAGFDVPQFSSRAPYWHCLVSKATP